MAHDITRELRITANPAGWLVETLWSANGIDWTCMSRTTFAGLEGRGRRREPHR